jgi:hypothetical protein
LVGPSRAPWTVKSGGVIVSPSIDELTVFQRTGNNVANRSLGRQGGVAAVALAALTLANLLIGLAGVAPVAAASVTDLPSYVTNYDNDSITEYAPDANGNARPIAEIRGPNTGLNGPLQVAVDSSGNLYAANFDDPSVTVYAPGANGNVAPIRTIKGPHTGLTSGPEAVAVDSSGNLYVATFGLNSVSRSSSSPLGPTATSLPSPSSADPTPV